MRRALRATAWISRCTTPQATGPSVGVTADCRLHRCAEERSRAQANAGADVRAEQCARLHSGSGRRLDPRSCRGSACLGMSVFGAWQCRPARRSASVRLAMLTPGIFRRIFEGKIPNRCTGAVERHATADPPSQVRIRGPAAVTACRVGRECGRHRVGFCTMTARFARLGKKILRIFTGCHLGGPHSRGHDTSF